MTMVKIKQQNMQIKGVIKIKLEFKDYKNCFEVVQTGKKVNHSEKIKTALDSLHTKQ